MIDVEFPAREVSLILSVVIFGVATAGAFVAWRMNGTGPPALKYGLVAVWLLTLLRLYSASSFVWGERASETHLFPVLRLGVLAILTLVLIDLLALVAYYGRRWRRERTR